MASCQSSHWPASWRDTWPPLSLETKRRAVTKAPRGAGMHAPPTKTHQALACRAWAKAAPRHYMSGEGQPGPAPTQWASLHSSCRRGAAANTHAQAPTAAFPTDASVLRGPRTHGQCFHSANDTPPVNRGRRRAACPTGQLAAVRFLRHYRCRRRCRLPACRLRCSLWGGCRAAKCRARACRGRQRRHRWLRPRRRSQSSQPRARSCGSTGPRPAVRR